MGRGSEGRMLGDCFLSGVFVVSCLLIRGSSFIIKSNRGGRPPPSSPTPPLKIVPDLHLRHGAAFPALKWVVIGCRNQGSCGSCYAFSSVGMMEARVRLRTNNTMQPVLSPQDIVSCSGLSQVRTGGWRRRREFLVVTVSL